MESPRPPTLPVSTSRRNAILPAPPNNAGARAALGQRENQTLVSSGGPHRPSSDEIASVGQSRDAHVPDWPRQPWHRPALNLAQRVHPHRSTTGHNLDSCEEDERSLENTHTRSQHGLHVLLRIRKPKTKSTSHGALQPALPATGPHEHGRTRGWLSIPKVDI